MKLMGINHIKFGPVFEVEHNHLSFKYASFEWALAHSNDSIKNLLNKVPIVGNHKYVVVDVKFHSLSPGQRPALPTWHIDCCSDIKDPRREEVHHIFVTDLPTEFLCDDVVLPYQKCATFPLGNDNLATIPLNTICTYGRIPHRAAITNRPVERTLIRVSETDIIAPKNKVLKPTIT